MKVNINIVLLISGALLAFILFQKCSSDSMIDELISDKDKVSNYYSKRDSANLAKINSQAEDVVKMEQIIVDQITLTGDLERQLQDYKDASMVESRVITRIDTLSISLHDTIVVDSTRLADSNCEYADSLIKEFKKKKNFFNFSDDWFAIGGSITHKNVSFDSVAFKNEFDVIIGYEKSKWYKRSHPVVELKSYSPYSKITYVNNIVVTDRRSSFEKTMTSKPAMLVYGILAGFIYANKN